MKSLLVLIAALLGFTGSAAGTSFKVRKVKTGDYDKIMVSGDFKVRLVPGKEGEIFVEGDRRELNYLVVRTEGNVLRIYPKKDFRVWCGDLKSITVVVPYESLDELILAGTGEISGEGIIKADTLKTQLSGKGKITVEVNANNTSVLLFGSGDITLSGSTGKFVSNIEGDGNILAYSFRSATTEATIIGSGKCEVNSSENLLAQVAGSGTINYSGDPKIEQKIIGSGLIAARE